MHVCSQPRYWHQGGFTPIVALEVSDDLPRIWCKLEFLNPSGSTKDRIARHILEKAVRQGRLKAGDTVVEASSGSTSIALALVCSQLGLKFHAFVPEHATSERLMMILAYGGEVTRLPGAMPVLIDAARAHADAEGAFLVRQFENPENPEAHRIHTAAEIVTQLADGRVDRVVSGIGTGGTLVGLHQGLRDAGCDALPVAAIPVGPLYDDHAECVSISFSKQVPGVVECCSEIYQKWKATPAAAGLVELAVAEERCLELTRQLWRLGFPVGPSSGLNLGACMAVAEDLPRDAVIVTVFPDRMERYFSHPVFGEIEARQH
jgi:cysteine synthase A